MGWWSCTILGGDSPLDLLSVIDEIVDYSYPKDDDFFSLYPFSQLATNDELRKSVKNALVERNNDCDHYFIDKQTSFKLDSESKKIFYQVTCSIYMASSFTTSQKGDRSR